MKSTATNVTEVTKQLLQDFCSKNLRAPYWDSNEVEEQASAFDQQLFEHVRTHIHSVTVDSASDEVAAIENMRSAASCTAIEGVAFAPYLKAVIRDKAHASRRILQRPWAVDPYLETVGAVLVSEKNSIAQMIQNSTDLKAWWEE